MVAVLFARQDSVYKTMPGLDVWDIDRDARKWPGGCPVVAHPPCARWSQINAVVLSRYSHKAEEFAWGNDGGCFSFAVEMVRLHGGVIEHPAGSRAFPHFDLPRVGCGSDAHGGWSCEVRQSAFGHRAEKRTWLYFVGISPDDLPALPPPRAASALVMRVKETRSIEVMGKAEREKTPPAFAAWLVEAARRCRIRRLAA